MTSEIKSAASFHSKFVITFGKYYAESMPAALKKTLFKFLTPFVIFLISSFITMACSQDLVYSGSGLVSSIGGVTFIQGAKQFWVSTPRPTFSGITTAKSNVDITIGSNKQGVISDASGNWSFTPAADLSGDNKVTVATSTTSVTFTLTIGALPANIASASAGTLAPAGSVNPTVLILSAGTFLILLGGFGLARNFKSQH